MHAVRHVLLLGSVLTLAACGGSEPEVESEPLGRTQAPLHQAAPDRRIEGAYIIKVRDGGEARSVAAAAGVSPRNVYALLNGFAATLDADQLHALRSHPQVEYVEEDQLFEKATTQTQAPWGLDRMDQRGLPLNGTYSYTSTGSCANAYIIDTGINVTHTQFGGRASNAYDVFGGTGADCQGHGTFVAGIVGGSTYGVAKGIKLRGVRVLDCAGSGSTSGVLSGIDWVRSNHVKPAVATLSLCGAYSTALNSAVTNLVNSGVFVAVPACNNTADACSYSPSSATAATTVGSTTNTDARAAYSNYGSCVDIYAPGSSITSAWYTTGTATTTMSGTSVSAGYVAGLAALYKCTYGDASQATIEAWLKSQGTTLPFGKLIYQGGL
ncbi:S8 family peptidase [Archangium violaceum]|uniref:S8 family peptidase n=1 Tax=Archangium violaceum TaxID=83451 RepID=UPI002B2F5A57|nr:S8 family peptidase [Archangium violaceum]